MRPTVTKSDYALRALLSAPQIADMVASNSRYNAFGSFERNDSLRLCLWRDHECCHAGQDSRLMLRTADDGQAIWNEAEIVWNPGNGHSIVEGGITLLEDGTYAIIATTENLSPFPSNQSQEAQVYLIRGVPGGWKREELLPATTSLYAACSGKLLETPAGVWLVPAFWDDIWTPGAVVVPTAGVLRSTDRGVTWARIPVTTLGVPNECQLMYNSAASIYLWIRSCPTGIQQGRSESTDGGLTWSVPISCTPPGYSPSRPCNIRLADNRIACIYRFPDGFTSEAYIAVSSNEGELFTDHELFRTGFMVYASGKARGAGLEAVVANHVSNTYTDIAISTVAYKTWPT